MTTPLEGGCRDSDPPVLITRRSQLGVRALQERVSEARDRLVAHRIAPSHRVALHLDESAEAVVLFLALAAHGCSVLVYDPRQFVDLAAMVAVGQPDHLVLPSGVVADIDVATTTLAELSSLPPGVVPPGGAPHRPDRRTSGAFPHPAAPWWQRADGLMLFSSGSTAGPKPIAKRPGDVAANAIETATALGYRDDDALLPILSLSHQYGFSVLLIGLLGGIPVIVPPFRRPTEAIRLGRRWGATVVEAPPEAYTVIARAISTGKLAGATTETVRLLGVGGGLVPRATAEAVRRAVGLPLVDGYGSTELGNVALADPAAPDDGLQPLPGFEVKVVPDHPAGGAGDGGMPVTGRLFVRPSAAQAWVDTGDLAVLDRSGALRVTGRHSAINRKGLVVHPAVVERQVVDAGIVAAAVVFGDDETQQYALAVEDPVRRSPAWWNRRVAELVAECDRPDRVLVRSALPRTATGKVDRARLRSVLEASDAEHPLSQLAEALVSRREDVIALMTGYCTRSAAMIEFDAAVAALRGGLAEAIEQQPAKLGESWVYLPSNVVLYSYVLYLLIPSLWTDRLTFRPSSRVRAATLALHELLSELAPMNVEPFPGSQRDFERLREGRVGLVVFTGRYGNAEQVRAGLGPGHVMAYFGQGTNPLIVGQDADVVRAGRDAAAMRMLNSGQDCFGPDLIAVHRSIVPAFLDELRHRVADSSLEKLTSAPDGEVRAAVDDVVLRDVVTHVSTHRDAVCWGGRVDLARGIVEATVLQWDMTHAPRLSEVFAPIFNVLVFDEEDDCRRLLESDFYRARWMGASLYGTSTDLALWCADRMTVVAEATLVAMDDPHQPFGGQGEIAGYVASRGWVRTGPLLLSQVAHRYAGRMRVPVAGPVRHQAVLEDGGQA